MGDERGIANIGDLAKPIDTFVAKVSEAITGLALPWQIERVARAEQKVALIKVQTELETAIKQRALERFILEESKKQENIEEITRKAIPDLNQSAQPESMENDWIANFFDKSRLISDDDMQNLWAKVLAGEANSPRTFSKRTINLLGSLDKSDAELFTNFCSFVWKLGPLIPIIHNERDKVFTSKGINTSSLEHLDSIGLVTYGGMGHRSYRTKRQRIALGYFGERIDIVFPKTPAAFHLGNTVLTRSGNELARVCGAEPYPEYKDYMIEKWRKAGFEVQVITGSHSFDDDIEEDEEDDE